MCVNIKHIAKTKKEFSQTVGANPIVPKIKYDFIYNNQTINNFNLKESDFARKSTLDFPVIVTTILCQTPILNSLIHFDKYFIKKTQKALVHPLCVSG